MFRFLLFSIIAFISTSILLGCADMLPASACPALKNWPLESERMMAQELSHLPDDSVLWSVMRDYIRMRTETKNCHQ